MSADFAPIPRVAILLEARSWIGTPYRHQASAKGAGCDCLGLIRGVWRALIGPEPLPTPAYRADWFGPGDTRLIEAAHAFLVPTPTETASTGDVLILAPRRDEPARHCAIVSQPGWIIHAYWGRTVAETPLGAFGARVAGAFGFPGVEPPPSKEDKD
ncbi:MAG: NlpC/P60 family protein [Maricaulaceae bacterium]